MEGHYASTAAGVAALPLLHTGPLEPLALPEVRKRLHDLSNTLTGLLGNLELAGMNAEDGTLDTVSLETALEAARGAVFAVRELKQQLDGHLPDRLAG
jgi:hypothetical protein